MSCQDGKRELWSEMRFTLIASHLLGEWSDKKQIEEVVTTFIPSHTYSIIHDQKIAVNEATTSIWLATGLFFCNVTNSLARLLATRKVILIYGTFENSFIALDSFFFWLKLVGNESRDWTKKVYEKNI